MLDTDSLLTTVALESAFKIPTSKIHCPRRFPLTPGTGWRLPGREILAQGWKTGGQADLQEAEDECVRDALEDHLDEQDSQQDGDERRNVRVDDPERNNVHRYHSNTRRGVSRRSASLCACDAVRAQTFTVGPDAPSSSRSNLRRRQRVTLLKKGTSQKKHLGKRQERMVDRGSGNRGRPPSSKEPSESSQTC